MGLRAYGARHRLDSRKQAPGWRLVFRKYFRKCSWDQHLKGMEGSRSGQREKFVWL